MRVNDSDMKVGYAACNWYITDSELSKNSSFNCNPSATLRHNMPLGRHKDNLEAWKLNGTQKILFCADDVNLFNKSINTIQQNRFSSG